MYGVSGDKGIKKKNRKKKERGTPSRSRGSMWYGAEIPVALVCTIRVLFIFFKRKQGVFYRLYVTDE